ncbi:MAG: aminoglycoside adenylyltransferase domain-containing protein [Butyricicoccaceae bacterium]
MSLPAAAAAVLEEIVRGSRAVFGDGLTGVYLHGSAAMDCFNPKTSDLDLLVVIEKPASMEEKLAFLRMLLEEDRQAPAGGIELSLLRREVCAPFRHPTPFELHFSPMHRTRAGRDPVEYVRQMRGSDPDLAAHVTILCCRGRCLYGAAVEQVFARPSPSDYFDSIWADVRGAREQILKQPVYTILNLCRVLAFVREGQVLSKREGGLWALERLPAARRRLVGAALDAYAADGRLSVPPEEGAAFAGEMLWEIRIHRQVADKKAPSL